MTIKLRPTERGFNKAVFYDEYGELCSIQKSSLASKNCIWLGCEYETKDNEGKPCGARMHLSQKLASDLIPLLQKFVLTGELE